MAPPAAKAKITPVTSRLRIAVSVVLQVCPMNLQIFA
jgi:hypothetical protein